MIENLFRRCDAQAAGVGAIYGKDSSQYEMAGGARKSEIKRAPRKKAAAK
jgi:hypothetical protein